MLLQAKREPPYIFSAPIDEFLDASFDLAASKGQFLCFLDKCVSNVRSKSAKGEFKKNALLSKFYVVDVPEYNTVPS